MARGGAGKRPHSPESDGEGAAGRPSAASAFPEEGVFPVSDPAFPKNPFIESLELDDESDDGEDLDNSFAAIAPHVDIMFDPPARRPAIGVNPTNRGNASPITESETESVGGQASTAWSGVKGPMQTDFVSGGVGGFDGGGLASGGSRGPVTTVNDKGVLVIRQSSDAGNASASPAVGGFPQLTKVRTRREEGQPLARGVSDAARGSNQSTPAVGAEGISPTSMQFAPEAADKYRTPREVPEAVFSPVASELREAQEDRITETPHSLLSPEGQRLAAAWSAQAIREGGAQAAAPWSSISNSSLVSRPVPEDVGTVLCYIVREKDSLYRLYTQQGTGRPDRLLLIAREHKRAGKTDFTIASTLAGIKSREPEDGFVGTVQGNVMGTRFALTGAGVREDETGTVEEKRLLAVTNFQGSAKKLSGDYRRMTVTVPKPVVVTASDTSAEAPVGSLALPDTWDAKDGVAQTAVLNTKVPYVRRVNGVTQHYLPYHGRCRLPSVKNFQLVYEDDQEHVVLMFGKDSKHTYCMDYSWPLCAHQAFGISLASIATKLCYAI